MSALPEIAEFGGMDLESADEYLGSELRVGIDISEMSSTNERKTSGPTGSRR